MPQAYSNEDKWVASIMSGLLFVLIASPFTYRLTNSVARSVGFDMADDSGCPSFLGTVVHGLVFTVLLKVMMAGQEHRQGANGGGVISSSMSKSQWGLSLLGGLLFVIVSNPGLYNLVDAVTEQFGVSIANGGCPTPGGVLVHGVVFTLITRVLMH